MQETQVPSLIQEDPTYCRATKPMHPNYWTCAPEPGSHNYWTHVPQLLKPTCPRACGLQQEKPPQWEAHALQIESGPYSPQLQKSPCCNEDPTLPNIKKETKSLARGEDSSSIPRALPPPHISHCVTAAVYMGGELAIFIPCCCYCC